jgi:hypothetical protein
MNEFLLPKFPSFNEIKFELKEIFGNLFGLAKIIL